MQKRPPPRVMGLIFAAIGAFVTWTSVLEPLWAAQAHAEQVRYSIKGAIVGPFALVLGLGMTLAGPRIYDGGDDQGKFSRVGWLVLAAALVAGIGALAGLEWWMDTLGYGVGRP